MAHFKKRGPKYDDALSQLGNIPGPLLLVLPTDLAAVLRRELERCVRLKVEWEAVADGTLPAFLLRGTAEGCWADALMPHLNGRDTYMKAPQGHPRPEWDDLIAVAQDHRILPDDTW